MSADIRGFTLLVIAGIGTGFMPMAVSTAAHPDRVKHIYRKAIKEITAAAGPSGASIIDTLDSAFDALDKSDEALSDGGIPIYLTTYLNSI